MKQRLLGKKIGIVVESEFLADEIEAYRDRFTEQGAEVCFMSRIWNPQSVQTYYSNSLEPENRPQALTVTIDFRRENPEDYAALIMASSYTSVRLRYVDKMPISQLTPTLARKAPACEFFARSMMNPQIVKGFLCQGLWILTPYPELLKGRSVICHQVVLADVINTGAVLCTNEDGVVVDKDIVTGYSKEEVMLFIDRITEQIEKISLLCHSDESIIRVC